MKLLIICVSLLSVNNWLYSVTYYFGGTLSASLGQYEQGTAYNGFFTYTYPQTLNEIQPDPSVPPVVARYVGSSISLSVGSETISFTNNPTNFNIWQYNKTERTFTGGMWRGGWNDDTFHIIFGGGSLLGGKLVNSLTLYLTDTTGSVFSDLNLVGDSMRAEFFDGGYFGIKYDGPLMPPFNTPQQIEVRSSVTNLVPEPSSLSLLLAGGAVALARRRKA